MSHSRARAGVEPVALLAVAAIMLGCGGARPDARPAESDVAGIADAATGPDAPTAVDPPDAQEPRAPDAEPDRAPDLAPDAAPANTVVLSEIMYHPVLEGSLVERHEFVELHNRGDEAVDLSGWKLAGEIDFTFPAGTRIAGRGFLVVAKDRAALAAVPGYALDADRVLGDYARELDNGGGQLSLVDGRGMPVDGVKYDDQFPWPIAADALGAGQSWLPPALLPLERHRHRGVSLERVSYDLPGDAVANWVPSALDGATPGRANRLTGMPPAIVETLSAQPASGQARVGATDEVLIRFRLSSQTSDVQVEYFRDDLERGDEAATSAPAAGAGLDREARLPAQAANSIVRYRIVGNLGAGREVISPRPSDPNPWHAYFVAPAIASPQPPYQLFIKSSDWGQLWTNIDHPGSSDRRVVPETIAGRTVRCQVRDSWDARVPAVFVHDGQVYDVRVRYQGSRWKRPYGRTIDLTRTTIAPLPAPMMMTDTGPSLSALSWNIAFPRYRRFDGGRENLILNKLAESCPGLSATVGELVYGAAGLMASPTRYRRFYVNGGYYAYVLDIEVPSEGYLRRQSPAAVGDLFKASGNQGVEEGPWGRGDLGPLASSCQMNPPAYDPQTRYRYTYERKTWDWKDASEVQALADGLDAARRAGHLDDNDTANDDPAPVRAFLSQTFDVQSVLTYLAIRNWSQPWDDFFHNHYLYKDSPGRWSLIPWDLDLEFGAAYGWDAHRSFFIGEKGDPDGRNGTEWNRLKDAFMRAFRPEIIARLRELDGGLLAPERWRTMVETAAARFDPAEAAASPVIGQCDFAAEKAQMAAFAEQRRAALADAVVCSSRACGLKGEYFRAPSFAPESLAFTRVDQVVDFNWGGLAPAPDFPADDFNARWTGQLTAPTTGLYTFSVRSDDGVRLWLGSVLLIDNWTIHPATVDTASVPLVAGIPYAIRLEYFEAGVEALISLSWSGPGVPLQRIGSRQLTPAP